MREFIQTAQTKGLSETTCQSRMIFIYLLKARPRLEIADPSQLHSTKRFNSQNPFGCCLTFGYATSRFSTTRRRSLGCPCNRKCHECTPLRDGRHRYCVSLVSSSMWLCGNRTKKNIYLFNITDATKRFVF